MMLLGRFCICVLFAASVFGAATEDAVSNRIGQSALLAMRGAVAEVAFASSGLDSVANVRRMHATVPQAGKYKTTLHKDADFWEQAAMVESLHAISLSRAARKDIFAVLSMLDGFLERLPLAEKVRTLASNSRQVLAPYVSRDLKRPQMPEHQELEDATANANALTLLHRQHAEAVVRWPLQTAKMQSAAREDRLFHLRLQKVYERMEELVGSAFEYNSVSRGRLLQALLQSAQSQSALDAMRVAPAKAKGSKSKKDGKGKDEQGHVLPKWAVDLLESKQSAPLLANADALTWRFQILEAAAMAFANIYAFESIAMLLDECASLLQSRELLTWQEWSDLAFLQQSLHGWVSHSRHENDTSVIGSHIREIMVGGTIAALMVILAVWYVRRRQIRLGQMEPPQQ